MNLIHPLTLIGIACAAILLKFIVTVYQNVFLHALRALPGPFLAKVFPQYMTPALLGGRRAQKLFSLHERYGSVVRVAPNEVSISDFSMYREIYSLKTSTKEESFYRAASFLGHEHIFSMRNKAQHAGRRKMETRPFSQQAILENEGLIISTARSLVQRILDPSGSPTVCAVDVYQLCGLFSLEVICKSAFNTDISQNSQEDGIRLLNAMDDSAKLLPIDAVFPFLKKYKLGQHLPGPVGHLYRQFNVWEKMTRDLFHNFQLESKNDSTERFIATPLLTNEDAFLGRKLTEDEAVEEAMGMAFAGSGTTSTTLVYLLYNLSESKNRHFQLKLRDELKNIDVSLNKVKTLPYLNAVIKETMRLNPTIISTLPRVLDVHLPITDTDILLPCGTVVGMQNYVHHRDSKIYCDPHSFNPDRWIGVSSSSDMEKALTPFGLGPANCIGQNLAMAELYLAVAVLFQQLDLQLNVAMKKDDMEMEDRFNIAPRGRRLLLDVKKL